MPLLDWLRGSKPPPPPHDPLDAALQRANEATAAALEAVNESRQRRGAPPLSWEDLIPRSREPMPRDQRREAS